MDNSRLKNLVWYHVFSAKILLRILFLILAINLALGFIFKKTDAPIGSIEIAALGFAVFVGYALFNDAFSFAMINGISRKTYYLANIISTFILSIILGVVTGIVTWISITYANNLILYTILYGKDIFGMFVWVIALVFASIAVFHFLGLVVYRISKKMRYILLGIGVLLGPAVYLLNLVFSGVSTALRRFALLFIGIVGEFGKTNPNPYLSAGMFLGLSAVVMGLSWLFLRRIETK